MKDMQAILKEHAFFKDLKAEYIKFIAGCASNVRFKEAEAILKEGQEADKFYLIKHGKVAIDIMVTQRRSITIQTIHDGSILGWSWLIPPHRYRFDARAVEDTSAIVLDGKCLRNKCEENHDLGYELLKKLTTVLTQRLAVTRMQLLDIYNINVKK